MAVGGAWGEGHGSCGGLGWVVAKEDSCVVIVFECPLMVFVSSFVRFVLSLSPLFRDVGYFICDASASFTLLSDQKVEIVGYLIKWCV